MRIYGLTYQGNIVLLEIVSAEIKVFYKVIEFKTATGDIWKLPYESQNDARMKLTQLNKTGELFIENNDDLRYMLRKDGE